MARPTDPKPDARQIDEIVRRSDVLTDIVRILVDEERPERILGAVAIMLQCEAEVVALLSQILPE